jgi:hypothetical protein
MNTNKIYTLTVLILLGLSCLCHSKNHIISLQVKHNDESIIVTPHLNFETSLQIKEAIDNGVKIYIIAKTQLFEPNNWWFDAIIINKKVTLEISYFTLSKLYVVKNKSTGKQLSFNSYQQLWSGFEKLMTVELVSDKNDKTWLKMRIMFDKRALPTVMQLPTLFDSDWDIDTEWHQQKVIINE